MVAEQGSGRHALKIISDGKARVLGRARAPYLALQCPFPPRTQYPSGNSPCSAPTLARFSPPRSARELPPPVPSAANPALGKQNPQHYYNGWSCCSKELINKHALVNGYSNPKKCALTAKVWLHAATAQHAQAVFMCQLLRRCASKAGLRVAH